MHHDQLRRALHQRAIARLAVAQRLLGAHALAGIAQTDHVDVAALDVHAADDQLRREEVSVLVARTDLVRPQVAAGRRRRAPPAPASPCSTEPCSGRSGNSRAIDCADDLGARIAEHALAGGIEDLDRAVGARR